MFLEKRPKALAELVGTKQSNISRLESGNYNPTLERLSQKFSFGKATLKFAVL
jgi:predicted transcriptional regulator